MHRVVHGVRHTVDDVIWRGDEGEEGAIGGGGRTNDSRAEGGVEELEERGGMARGVDHARGVEGGGGLHTSESANGG